MTGNELIKCLQRLSDEELEQDVVMFDGPSYYTPYKVEVMGDKCGENLKGKIMID